MAENSSHTVDISFSSILKLLLIVVFFIFIYLLKDVLIIFLFALVIASAMTPFANWLESKGLPRIFGVLFLYLVIFGLIVFILSLIVPFVSQQVLALTQNLPSFVNRFSTSLDDVQNQSKYFDFVSELQNLLDSFGTYLQQFSQSAFSLVVSTFGGVFSFIAVVVISFYLAVMKNGIGMFLESIVPEKYERYVSEIWHKSELKVGRWLQGQLLLSLVVGILVFVGLSILGVKYALLLAVLALILEIVPIAGPVLAGIPAVILAFLESPTLGIWVLILYLAIQQLENHVLTPIIIGKTTGLNPVAVIIALLIGFDLAGIPGMILAVPIATIFVEILDDLARTKGLRKTMS